MTAGRIALVVLVLIVVAAGGSALAGSGETRPTARPPAALAERLGAELSIPAADIREALRAVRSDRRAERAARRGLRAQQRKHATTGAQRRQLRAERRARRTQRRRQRAELRGDRPAPRFLRRLIHVRDRLAPELAAKLHLEPAKLTSALRAILAQRLDRAVARGRLTAGGRTAALACFDDRARCQGVRARLRRP
jgi:hypothetical protein